MRNILAALLTAALCLGLAACGPAPEPEPTPTPTPSVSPSPEAAEFALACYPEAGFHPITGSNRTNLALGGLLYEGLFALDRQFQPQEALCASASVSADGLQWSFIPRSGVTFSDGSPLTAAEIAASLNLARTSPLYSARFAGVTDIAAANGMVTVTLSRANGALPALLDIPIVKSGTEESLTPVGTGPYYFTTDEAGACLASHSGWWRGESRPAERIALSAARDREAILYQFSSHEVQLITADLIGTEPITATGNISYEDADTTVLQFLGFNTARAPFQDSAARRALGLGINRETLVSAVLSGHARAAQFPVSPVSPLYPAELESLYSYDDFAAAMEAAGLNTGRTRTVTLLVNQENTFKVSAAEHIAQALSDFDLQIQVEALPWEEYAAALAAGNFDLYYGEVRLPANWDLSALVGTGGSLNYGGWADPQTEQLLAACAAAEDRAAALSDLCAYLQQQAPILPLCFKSSSVLYQTGAVSGLTPTAAEPFYDLPSTCGSRKAALSPRAAPGPGFPVRARFVFPSRRGKRGPSCTAAGILSHGITAANGRFPRKGCSRTACGQRPFSSGVVRGPGIRGLRGNRCPARWCADDLHNR